MPMFVVSDVGREWRAHWCPIVQELHCFLTISCARKDCHRGRALDDMVLIVSFMPWFRHGESMYRFTKLFQVIWSYNSDVIQWGKGEIFNHSTVRVHDHMEDKKTTRDIIRKSGEFIIVVWLLVVESLGCFWGWFLHCLNLTCLIFVKLNLHHAYSMHLPHGRFLFLPKGSTLFCYAI